MAMLNRTAIIIIPKQPYADWANAIDDGPRFELSEANDELTVFLGPDLDTVDEINAFVTKHFQLFFEHWRPLMRKRADSTKRPKLHKMQSQLRKQPAMKVS